MPVLFWFVVLCPLCESFTQMKSLPLPVLTYAQLQWSVVNDISDYLTQENSFERPVSFALTDGLLATYLWWRRVMLYAMLASNPLPTCCKAKPINHVLCFIRLLIWCMPKGENVKQLTIARIYKFPIEYQQFKPWNLKTVSYPFAGIPQVLCYMKIYNINKKAT